MEEFGQARVGEKILTPVGGVRPCGVLQERLAPQLLGNAQALQGSEARDALAPVRVLGLAQSTPVAGDELANAACDHDLIVPRAPALPHDRARASTRQPGSPG